MDRPRAQYWGWGGGPRRLRPPAGGVVQRLDSDTLQVQVRLPLGQKDFYILV